MINGQLIAKKYLLNLDKFVKYLSVKKYKVENSGISYSTSKTEINQKIQNGRTMHSQAVSEKFGAGRRRLAGAS